MALHPSQRHSNLSPLAQSFRNELFAVLRFVLSGLCRLRALCRDLAESYLAIYQREFFVPYRSPRQAEMLHSPSSPSLQIRPFSPSRPATNSVGGPANTTRPQSHGRAPSPSSSRVFRPTRLSLADHTVFAAMNSPSARSTLCELAYCFRKLPTSQ